MEKQLPPKQLLATQLLSDGLPVKAVSELGQSHLNLIQKYQF
jgi:hypothetical protein